MWTFKMNNLYARKLLATVLVSAPMLAFAEDAAAPVKADPAAVAMRNMLAQRYPNTKFGEIQRSAVPGLWEVWMGANVAFVADEGRHFVFGHLYDMQTQTDLTAVKKEQVKLQMESAKPKVAFADLPLADAIKTVRGNGQRKLAVFSDPHCPYCRDLERELEQLNNVTVYTFLFPIESIHPAAAGVAKSIWCAKDRPGAWKTFMATGEKPQPSNCAGTPIERNVELAGKAGIHGTPFLIFANGEKAAGLLDTASLERRLSRN
jgi:thiol:disulfide interchange protein DsbC